MYSEHELLHQIEKLRLKMCKIALSEGATAKEAVFISQELDHLLNLYEHEFNLKKTKNFQLER